MADPVVHFEVMGKDAEALSSFYTALFGWKTNPVGGPVDYRIVEPAGERGIRGGIGGSQESDGHVTFYVQVKDIRAALERAQSLGGHVVAPPMDVPGGGTIATFTDPEGHMIGLFSSQEEETR